VTLGQTGPIINRERLDTNQAVRRNIAGYVGCIHGRLYTVAWVYIVAIGSVDESA